MIRITVIVATLVFLNIPSPAFAKDYINMNLISKSGLCAEDIDKVFTKTPLEGLGKEFVQVEETYGINAQYFAAHAILESDWGRSRIATEKNNLFGFGAHDKAPYRLARQFNSKEEGIEKIACFIKNKYLTPGGQYFNGPTLVGMNKKYASDPLWAQKVANRMGLFEPYLPPQPQLKSKKEKKDFKELEKNKTKEVSEMKADVLLNWMLQAAKTHPKIAIVIAVLFLALLLRRWSATLQLATAPIVALIWAILSVLKTVILAFFKSIIPAIKEAIVEVFCPIFLKDVRGAKELFKNKRQARKQTQLKARRSINTERAMA